MGIAKMAGMAGICLLATGCAYFDPYVLPEIGPAAESGSGDKACDGVQLPQTCRQVNEIRSSAQEVRSRLKSSVVTRRSVDLASFGLLAGFGAKVIHGSATSTGAMNLAYGGVATYTAGTLFWPPTTEGVYLGAYDALACVAGKGVGLDAVTMQAKALHDSGADTFKCAEPARVPADAAAFEQARNSWNALGQTLRLVKSADRSVAARIHEASSNTQMALNQQLLADRPSPQAVFAAAKGMSAIASGVVVAPTQSATLANGQGDKWKQLSIPAPTTCVPAAEVSTAMKIDLDRTTKALTDQFNALDDLLVGCGTSQAEKDGKDFVVTPSSVVLTAASNVAVVSTAGGRPPILAEWINPPAGKDSDIAKAWNPVVNGVSLSLMNPKLKGDYLLRITDSAIVPHFVDVEVIVKQ